MARAPSPITLADYVRRRNGVPLGAAGSLRNMLSRSFGASSFAGFWRYWNPIFGYALARYVHSPLLGVLPRSLAVIATFAVCGAIHDLVTTLVRGSVACFFTPWFVALGAGAVLSNAVRMNLSHRPWWFRAAVHTSYLVACLVIAVAVQATLGRL
jgi:D-alanyl-lipoteichoic acid acyltransferase DltB (MBOAT superfamily)